MNKTNTQLTKDSKATIKAKVDLKNVISELDAYIAEVDNLITQIEMKIEELENIFIDIANKERQARVDLSIRLKENEAEVIAGYLKQRNEVAVDSTLHKENLQGLAGVDDAIKEAVEAKELELTEKFVKDSKIIVGQMESKHAVETASLKADHTALQNKISFMEDTIKELRDTINAERKARVEIANASPQTINVGT